jgi:hypothetical protein
MMWGVGTWAVVFSKRDPLYDALSTLLIFSHQIAKIGDKNSNTVNKWLDIIVALGFPLY